MRQTSAFSPPTGNVTGLRTPHILNLLGGTDEVEAVLEQAESFEQADSFDAQSYRAAYLGHRERLPADRQSGLLAVAPAERAPPDRRLEGAAARPGGGRRRFRTRPGGNGQAQTWRVGENGLTFDGA
ncbi:hypothetical protein [Streptosporangium vulgare]|uniref:hypothetical protein n=1 Tax=Streptosporangium vulgare TaxID=46190 RepID=UPI0031D19495